MTRTLLCATFLCLAALFSACSTEPSTRDALSLSSRVASQDILAQVTRDSSSIIMIGDSVVFSVWRYPDFTTRTIVKPSGSVSIPLVGEMRAAGYSRSAFEENLKQRLSEYIKGEIRLGIEVQGPLPRITVVGTVTNQTSFQSLSEVPLLQVLAIAGGWTENSDIRYLKLVRKEGFQIEIDLDDVLVNGNVQSLPMVRPGDVVVVPRKENVVREVSEFLRDAFLIFGFFNIFN